MSEEKHILSFWRYISFAAAALILVIVLFLSFYAVRDLAADVESIRSAPVPEGFDAALCYDDRLYACLLFGEEILPDDPLAEQRIEALISTSLHHFCERIFAAGLMYTMVISCTLAYYIYTVSNNEIAKHAAYIVLSAFAVYALYIGSVGIMFTSFGLQFSFPDVYGLLTAAAGLLSVAGGGCAAGMLLRKIRFKKIAAVLLIPAAFILLLYNMVSEYGLIAPAEVPAFDYVYEQHSEILDEDYSGNAYYDEQKNVLIIDGEEYPPEMADNPDRLSGLKRALALVFELLFPWSGTGLYMVSQAAEIQIPVLMIAAYILKAMLWILIPSAITGRRDEQTDK